MTPAQWRAGALSDLRLGKTDGSELCWLELLHLFGIVAVLGFFVPFCELEIS